MKSSLPPYSLKRSRRKTLSIYIERNGDVTVLAPERFSDEEVKDVLTQKSYQIYKHLATQAELNSRKSNREIANGESFLYLGRNYRLELIDRQAEALKLKDGYFLLRRSDRNNAKEVFKNYYSEKGTERIAERVSFYHAKMNVNPRLIRVLDLKNRWASCSPKGDLNFHWKCVMAPITILDYIVVHEMAHLKHPHHTEAFWNEVDKILPDYLERKSWLRLNGAGMDL